MFLGRFFRIAAIASILAVAANVGWAALGEFNKSESARADASFLMVNHQTGRMGDSLNDARTFISDEISQKVSQLTNISSLTEAWSPRFAQAGVAYDRFDAAIFQAESSAEAYFEAQRALTKQFHDPELRQRAKKDDDAEFRQYNLWRDRAHVMRRGALEILRRLDDMDTTLRKLTLRSDFSIAQEAFREVPSDILALERELDQFRTASDSIRELIGSPFDGEN